MEPPESEMFSKTSLFPPSEDHKIVVSETLSNLQKRKRIAVAPGIKYRPRESCQSSRTPENIKLEELELELKLRWLKLKGLEKKELKGKDLKGLELKELKGKELKEKEKKGLEKLENKELEVLRNKLKVLEKELRKVALEKELKGLEKKKLKELMVLRELRGKADDYDSVGTPLSLDSIGCSLKSSIENTNSQGEIEVDADSLSSQGDVLPDNELWVDLDRDFLVDPPDYLKLKSVPLLKDLKWYFSLFPPDFEFDKDSLIQLWIAEGFIMNESMVRMEDLGSVCFSRLLDEGFIVSSGYYHSSDKFKYKVNEAKIGERLMFDGNKLDDIPANSRRLSLWCMDINHRTSAAIKKCEHLSSLLLFPHHGSCINHIPRDIFLSLKGLLVLNLSQLDILEIPSSIGAMTSLLYLDVSETPIKWLPESIGCLEKLQTLKLRCCFNLFGLPKSTMKLINLRHLDLDVVRQFNSMPAGLGSLINLQTLSAFIIGEYDGCRIGELKNMSNLSGEFCLVNLENVVDSNEALEAALWKKSYIQKLELTWSDSCSETVNEDERILEHLRPHHNLQELKINFYSGSKLPNWVSSPSYLHLVSISFNMCRNCQFLPAIGTLPSLKFLYINEMNCVKEISRQFFKNKSDHVGYAFPKLEKLSIDVMLGLEKWKEIELGDLPCLLKLTMQCCPELVTLPSFSGLKSLKHLEVIDCPKLPSLPEGLPTSLEFLLVKDCPILKEWFSSESGGDWRKESHVPLAHIWIDLEEISSQI